MKVDMDAVAHAELQAKYDALKEQHEAVVLAAEKTAAELARQTALWGNIGPDTYRTWVRDRELERDAARAQLADAERERDILRGALRSDTAIAEERGVLWALCYFRAVYIREAAPANDDRLLGTSDPGYVALFCTPIPNIYEAGRRGEIDTTPTKLHPAPGTGVARGARGALAVVRGLAARTHQQGLLEAHAWLESATKEIAFRFGITEEKKT